MCVCVCAATAYSEQLGLLRTYGVCMCLNIHVFESFMCCLALWIVCVHVWLCACVVVFDRVGVSRFVMQRSWWRLLGCFCSGATWQTLISAAASRWLSVLACLYCARGQRGLFTRSGDIFLQMSTVTCYYTTQHTPLSHCWFTTKLYLTFLYNCPCKHLTFALGSLLEIKTSCAYDALTSICSYKRFLHEAQYSPPRRFCVWPSLSVSMSTQKWWTDLLEDFLKGWSRPS